MVWLHYIEFDPEIQVTLGVEWAVQPLWRDGGPAAGLGR